MQFNEEQPRINKIACKACTKSHHKCDKMLPSCSHCLKRKIPCEINISKKKRGRPFGTTKANINKKKQEEGKRKIECTFKDLKNEITNKKVKIIEPKKEVIPTLIREENITIFDSPKMNTKKTSFGDSSIIFDNNWDLLINPEDLVLNQEESWLHNLEFDCFNNYFVDTENFIF